jgi:hypothetical protein
MDAIPKTFHIYFARACSMKCLHWNAGVNSRLALVFVCIFSFISLLLICPPAVASAMQFSGKVVDPTGQPINEAIVRLQGTSFSALTNQTGHFTILTNKAVSSKYITAWKDGYYNGGHLVSLERTECSIQLSPIRKEDNQKYEWLPSLYETSTAGKPEIKPCQKCHAGLTEQWRKSTHATSAINPIFLAFFRGTDKDGKKNAGPGYKLDFPNANGNCSTCHVPAMALNNPFNSDPFGARGVAREGVFCDFCHKIDNARIDNTGGYPGTMSLQFNRPSDGHQLFYGSYDDVYPGDDSNHPLYKDSRYCAPCHHGKFWDVEMYSEYKEWAESDYAEKNISCQSCHMSPDGVTTRFALKKEGGIKRRPETIPSHLFTGISDLAFMKEAIELEIQTEMNDNHLTVVATIRNVKAGHHYPTGNPMRNMILLVDVTGENKRRLPFIRGDRVPVWGGIGTARDGNYAGLPGKGFAKVLRDSVSYPADQRQRHFKPEYPAPHWRPSIIESDNRIPAYGEDISRYEYLVPQDLRGRIRINARLIYRKAYKKWLDAKGIAEKDMEVARMNLLIRR